MKLKYNLTFFFPKIFYLNLEIIELIFDAIAAKLHQKVLPGLTKLSINFSQIYLFMLMKHFEYSNAWKKKEKRSYKSKQSRKRRENSKFINVTYIYVMNTLLKKYELFSCPITRKSKKNMTCKFKKILISGCKPLKLLTLCNEIEFFHSSKPTKSS